MIAMLERCQRNDMKVVTCIVAHPDDEVLGVGGTLARHVMEGDAVYVLIVCANTFRGQKDPSNAQMEASMKELGIQYYSCLNLDDQRLEEYKFSELVDLIRGSMIGETTDVFYTHWYKDLNRDHRLVNEAVQLIARPKHGRKFEVREFPTPSSTEYSREGFAPDTWIDIGSTLQKKMKAMACYKTELQESPLPRNPESLLYLANALGGQVGLKSAEVFRTVRRVI